MKTLWEIESAIAGLPQESRSQLVRDLPALCPEALPTDGWDAILADATPRPALTSLLDSLDEQYRQKPEQFYALNEDSLRDSSDLARHAGILAALSRPDRRGSRRSPRGAPQVCRQPGPSQPAAGMAAF